MQTSFKLNGVAIKRPSSFKTSFFKISKSNRIANGDMTMEIIAKKRKFFFTYDALYAKDAQKIMDQIWDAGAFYTLEYVEDNVEKKATVYAGEVSKELHRSGANWVWKNFTFNLIER